MNSEAIAANLRVLELIPEGVEHRIKQSTSKEDANSHLLNFLKEEATGDQVQRILKFASEKPAYGRMSEFAVSILQKMQTGLHLCVLCLTSGSFLW